MKIVLDGRFYGLKNAGLGRYSINLIDQLSRIDKRNNYVLLLRDEYYKKLKLPENWEKVRVNSRHYSLREQVEVPIAISKLKPDLVHFPHFNVPLGYQGKFVVTIHDMLMHEIKGKAATTLPWYKYLVKRVGYKKVFTHAVKDSFRIVVPSKTVKSEVLNYYKVSDEKVVVSYEGYEKRTVKEAEKRVLFEKYNLREPYFFYVGNAYPHKNLERLIEAAVYIDAFLVIATPRNFFGEKLRKMTVKNRNVRVLGFVTEAELRGLYKNSCAFVYPSLVEGFGLQGLEAIANGTVLLMSDIETFYEIYDKQAIYFNPHDFSAIARSMEIALKINEVERKRIVKDGQKFIKRYSWEKMAHEILGVYNDALE